MINRRQLKEKAKELQKEDKQIYDEEGRAVINMTVLDDNEFLSPYGEEKDIVISRETAAFLEHSTRAIHHNRDLTLVISSNVIDEKEKVLYKKGIHNYFENSFLALQKDLKRNLWTSIIFALIGVLYFAVLIVVSLFVDYDLILEMLSIAGWVFLWEAVELFFIDRTEMKNRQYRAYAFLNAKIIYEELNKKS